MTVSKEKDLTYSTFLSISVMIIGFAIGLRISHLYLWSPFGWAFMIASLDVIVSMLINFFRKRPSGERTRFETIAMTAFGLMGLGGYFVIVKLDDTLDWDDNTSFLSMSLGLWVVCCGYSAWDLSRNAAAA